MIGYDFKSAQRGWDREVEAEAVRLIKSGVPPYDAMDRARDIVSRRRREKVRESSRAPEGTKE